MLIFTGVLVILFAGFQLYGTGILERQAQDELTTEFDAKLEALTAAGLITQTPAVDDSVTNSDASSDTAPDEGVDEGADEDDGGVIGGAEADGEAALDERFQFDDTIPGLEEAGFGERNGPEFEVSPIDPDTLSSDQIALLTPQAGEALGTIEIPDIGLTRNIVEGIRRDDLRKGPGHYPGSPLPGQPGNSSIAGHRTTYGQPFYDLDQLEPGDLIKVTTVQGEHFYEVMPYTNDDGDEVGYFIVDPSQTEVLEDFGDNRLTLTACHPKRSSRQRIVVTALLVSAPQPVLPALTEEQVAEINANAEVAEGPVEELAFDDSNTIGVEENALSESLGWNFEERPPTLAWGFAAFAVAMIGLALGRFWRKWPVYALTTPVFLVLLFFSFVHLDRMLPAL